MTRRISVLSVVVGALVFVFAAAPAAFAQDIGSAPSTLTFGHDDALDGTPGEIVSGAFGGDDGVTDPLDPTLRVPNSFESFPFVVPEGDPSGSITVNVTWQDPRLDIDLYLYRYKRDGTTLVPTSIASSASFGDNDEELTYYPAIASNPVEPGRYLVVVDNWCTDETDPVAIAIGGCGIGDPIPTDEDDFIGKVTFGAGLPFNAPPTAGLTGPDSVKAGDVATFTAAATDADGRVANYAFDLDGDGRFETDNATSNVVVKRFDTAGSFNVGVRVTDDAGARSYASKKLTVTAAASTATLPRTLITGFKLNRPVFGGRSRSKLKVTYRLREAGRVTLSLWRGKKRVKRLVDDKARAGGRTYRVTVKPRGLRRGNYTLRLRARSSQGATKQTAKLFAKRL